MGERHFVRALTFWLVCVSTFALFSFLAIFPAVEPCGRRASSKTLKQQTRLANCPRTNLELPVTIDVHQFYWDIRTLLRFNI